VPKSHDLPVIFTMFHFEARDIDTFLFFEFLSQKSIKCDDF